MDGQHESDALDAQGTTMRTNILITLPVGFVGINLHRTNVVFQLVSRLKQVNRQH